MNTAFLLAVVALCAGAVGFVLFPLLRESGGAVRNRSQREVNAAIYRDRLAELQHDVAQGTLTREQYDVAVADLERELVQSGAIESDDSPPQTASRQRTLLIASGTVAALGVPLLAIGLYGNVGFSDVVFQDGAQTPAQLQAQGGGQSQRGGGMPSDPHDTEAFEELAQQLRARLAANPDEQMGWVLLARTLVFLGNFEEASEAFAEAVTRGGSGDPDLLVQYADVLGEAKGSLQGKPKELIDKALALAPEHPQGLWLAGTAAYHEQDYPNASHYWERLLSVLPPDSEGASIIRSNLDEVEALAADG